MMPVKLRSFEAKRYLIFKPISYYKLSEGTQLFSSPNCTKFYNIDSDKISEFLFGKYDIFTTRSERSTYLLARADNSDVFKYVLNCTLSKVGNMAIDVS